MICYIPIFVFFFCVCILYNHKCIPGFYKNIIKIKTIDGNDKQWFMLNPPPTAEYGAMENIIMDGTEHHYEF